MRECSVPLCAKPVVARNYCRAHYEWSRRNNFETPTHKVGSIPPPPGKAWKQQASSSNWTRENLAWAAGFIDGEGSVYFQLDPTDSSRNQCALTTYQKDPELLERLTKIFGTGSITKHPEVFAWHVTRKNDVYAILVALYPWMSTRRQSKIQEFIKVLYHGETSA